MNSLIIRRFCSFRFYIMPCIFNISTRNTFCLRQSVILEKNLIVASDFLEIHNNAVQQVFKFLILHAFILSEFTAHPVLFCADY